MFINKIYSKFFLIISPTSVNLLDKLRELAKITVPNFLNISKKVKKM